ncbi:MAG: hypothetical protein R2827_15775 [Bdellovibrionales bacterium]
MKRFSLKILAILLGTLFSFFVVLSVDVGLALRFGHPHISSLLGTCETYQLMPSCNWMPRLNYLGLIPIMVEGAFKQSREVVPFERAQKIKMYLPENWDQKDIQPWEGGQEVLYSYRGGHRLTPVSDEKAKAFIAFFGGSWVHGDWLNNNETLPYYIGRELTGFQPYNFGTPGGDLQTSYVISRQQYFSKKLKQEKGLFVYVYTQMHDQRLLPVTASAQILWGRHRVNYLPNSTTLGYAGSHQEATPFLLPALNYLHFSGFGMALNMKDRNFPKWEISQLQCDMLVQFKNHLLNIKPGSQFVVLMYNNKLTAFSQCLDQNNVKYWLTHERGRYELESLPDGHPPREVIRKLPLGLHQF